MSAPSARTAQLPGVVAQAALPDGGHVRILRVDAASAVDLLAVVHAAFAARPPVEPPPAALSDTLQSIAEALDGGFGMLAAVDGRPVAGLIVGLDGEIATISRVAVLPDFRRRGIAGAMVQCAMDLLAADGVRTLAVRTRTEFPAVAAWWTRHGFVRVGEQPPLEELRRRLPVLVEAPTADAMQALGARLAGLLRAGDVLIATGDLGAGKTTLTQGIGAGLGVAGPGHLADLRALPGAPRRPGRPRRWCTWTPTGWAPPSSSRTSTWTPPLAGAVTVVEWGAGHGRGTWPTTGWRSTSGRGARPTRAGSCSSARSVIAGATATARAGRRPSRREPAVADPVVLALDTSTDVAVGLPVAGDVLGLARLVRPDGRTPSSWSRCCTAASADAASPWPTSTRWSSASAPGPFTGLRVGVVTAQVLAAVARRAGARRLQPGRGRRRLRTRPQAATSWWPPTPAAGRSTGPATPPTAPGRPARGRRAGGGAAAADRGPVTSTGAALAGGAPGPSDPGVLAVARAACPTRASSRSTSAGRTPPSRPGASPC